ncbi:hypothetical protein F2Q70_00002741 [Brassica cretica]|uniref:Uncharacterized protein n=1 Tax=Brassica cretica TaxID=69181 RepID=A0A3N6SRJ1_BRACR|nr:hypothetical protein F2Q70_00002741 [Brassica cretica]KAF3563204.1 hypothetical protein DY000_02014356 [Brassica cretica]
MTFSRKIARRPEKSRSKPQDIVSPRRSYTGDPRQITRTISRLQESIFYLETSGFIAHLAGSYYSTNEKRGTMDCQVPPRSGNRRKNIFSRRNMQKTTIRSMRRNMKE